jgi:hypothetical protein
MRPAGGPPAAVASAAPPSPGMNAPDAACWWLPTGPVVVAGLVVVTGLAVVDETDDDVVADELTGAAVDDVVVGSPRAGAFSPLLASLEHPTPSSATVRSRTGSLTTAHHRARLRRS